MKEMAVFKGIIKRLRVYDQPETTGNKVFVYLAPGTQKNYVGNSSDPNVIHALFLACDNGRAVQGFANEKFIIEWIDYAGS